MKQLTLSGDYIYTGKNSIEALKKIACERVFLVTGGNSMKKYGWVDKITSMLEARNIKVYVYDGIGMNPSKEEVRKGLEKAKEIKPDCMLAVGGGSAMDAAKAMLLFYEFPWLNFDNVAQKNQNGEIPVKRNTMFICIPSTSGTGSEVTRGTVITDLEQELKIPIMTDVLRPDIAILDPDLTMSMPDKIVAETGIDALTHATEAYLNHNLDDFSESLCLGAIRGILKWLPISYEEKTVESREKVHNFQAMAGIGFANTGLGMVHGIAHAYGAIFQMAHGLTNAIILPYALTFNQQDPVVAKKLKELAYHCKCDDFIEEVKALEKRLHIPETFQKAGVSEKQFLEKQELLVEHSLLGATKVNPVFIEKEEMKKLIPLVYYGKEMREQS